MTIEATLERVSAIRQALADPQLLLSAQTGGAAAPDEAAGAQPGQATTTAGGGEGTFASALAAASAQETQAAAPTASEPAAGGGTGARIVAAAESQIGQAEQPLGSNESPAIAEYRSATAGAIPGAPWCAYFASWAAREAGEPIGPSGEGLGSVAEIWSWAQASGRAIPNGPGVTPKPGDLIVFGDEHVGIVREVLPDGRIATIEGNYENKVAANTRSPTEASGYVEMD